MRAEDHNPLLYLYVLCNTPDRVTINKKSAQAAESPPQGQVQNHGLLTLITLQGITTAHVIVPQTQTRTTE